MFVRMLGVYMCLGSIDVCIFFTLSMYNTGRLFEGTLHIICPIFHIKYMFLTIFLSFSIHLDILFSKDLFMCIHSINVLYILHLFSVSTIVLYYFINAISPTKIKNWLLFYSLIIIFKFLVYLFFPQLTFLQITLQTLLTNIVQLIIYFNTVNHKGGSLYICTDSNSGRYCLFCKQAEAVVTAQFSFDDCRGCYSLAMRPLYYIPPAFSEQLPILTPTYVRYLYIDLFA